jgi:hypothetical protein
LVLLFSIVLTHVNKASAASDGGRNDDDDERDHPKRDREEENVDQVPEQPAPLKKAAVLKPKCSCNNRKDHAQGFGKACVAHPEVSRANCFLRFFSFNLIS